MTSRLELRIEKNRMILGDCREILPSIEGIGAIITDPVWPNARDDLPGSENPFALFQDFCLVLPKTLRQLVVVLRNDSDPRFLRAVPERLKFQQVAWCKYAMPGYYGRVLGGSECAYVFGEPIRSRPGKRVIPSQSPIAQPADRTASNHPCGRHITHQRWLVDNFSESDELVCDPFMGGGTCAEACVLEGRRFVGIEIVGDFFQSAVDRVKRALKQPDMFVKQ
jgi:site-specific DNA-methyltransferase (adenine-specific)